MTALSFSCTACGACCTRGPEMELSEATDLADIFITRLLFKLHSLPLDARRAGAWWKNHGSFLPAAKALDEARDHLERLSIHSTRDAANGRSLHLTISALTVHGPGPCPALRGSQCGIHERRPFTCRTVPFHYSRPASTLPGYVAAFTRTPGYRCGTDSFVDKGEREQALGLVARDHPWRRAICDVILGGDAPRHGLPSYGDIVTHAAARQATTASMSAAWAVAVGAGLISESRFAALCSAQAALLRPQADDPVFADMLADYDALANRAYLARRAV